MTLHLRAAGCHLSYEITQCYLSPDTSEHTMPSPQPDRRLLDLPVWECWLKAVECYDWRMSMSMSNVKNIYRRRRMSRVRIGGAGGRRNVILSRMQQRTVLFLRCASFGVFPLHQIAHVGVSPSRSLKLFGREMVFEVFQPVWKSYLNVTDRRTVSEIVPVCL